MEPWRRQSSFLATLLKANPIGAVKTEEEETNSNTPHITPEINISKAPTFVLSFLL